LQAVGSFPQVDDVANPPRTIGAELGVKIFKSALLLNRWQARGTIAACLPDHLHSAWPIPLAWFSARHAVRHTQPMRRAGHGRQRFCTFA
jgi:hypothetical protein